MCKKIFSHTTVLSVYSSLRFNWKIKSETNDINDLTTVKLINFSSTAKDYIKDFGWKIGLGY